MSIRSYDDVTNPSRFGVSRSSLEHNCLVIVRIEILFWMRLSIKIEHPRLVLRCSGSVIEDTIGRLESEVALRRVAA